MTTYVLDLQQIDKSALPLVGGKGANLGELSHIDGVLVPPGFCVTTEAYEAALAGQGQLDELLDQLNAVTLQESSRIGELSAAIRSVIEAVEVPGAVAEAVLQALARHGSGDFYAVRSSATAEDLPGASFAGQQETYLNIRGPEAILRHMVKCWASLFTERAVTYRIQNGFDHRRVALAVVIQQMVPADASGILFTADPVSSDRSTLAIEAGFGLGEALVSGRIDPDEYRVRGGAIASKRIGRQHLQIAATPEGGTVRQEVPFHQQNRQALSDEQILALAATGKRIEAHFGYPQDIEWCCSGGRYYVVQSRPITTLFPVPESRDPRKPRVFMSVGHTQMMTGAMKPLGMSVFAWIAQFTLDQAGGRLFADITHDLSSVMGRNRLMMATGKQDPLIQSAVRRLMEDRAFISSLPRGRRNLKGGAITPAAIVEALKLTWRNDPSVIDGMLTRFEQEVQEVDRRLSRLQGAEALAFIEADRTRLMTMAYDARMLGAIIASLLAADSLNRHVAKWLGEKNVADTLSKSVEHDITTAMGLALCDLADTARQYPPVVDFFASHPSDEHFFEQLASLPGGAETGKAFRRFLATYGMRCPGEIDITRPRWAEQPTQLLPMLLNNIRVLAPGEHVSRFHKGQQEAAAKEAELTRRLEALPGGRRKAARVRKSIAVLRNFAGCREYPKYYIVRRFQLYKGALLREADRLVAQGVIRTPEDIFYLTFDDIRAAITEGRVDPTLIEARRAAFHRYERLSPPRIITSDGYVPSSDLASADAPRGALLGIPVSSGVVEGRARVVSTVDEARIEEGDILVTHFTDPSWTPLFVAVTGLVTEVGGYTTHGAVITREYGLPAVVGVEGATRVIRDGQRIRVNGTEGYVEIL